MKTIVGNIYSPGPGPASEQTPASSFNPDQVYSTWKTKVRMCWRLELPLVLRVWQPCRSFLFCRDGVYWRLRCNPQIQILPVNNWLSIILYFSIFLGTRGAVLHHSAETVLSSRNHGFSFSFSSFSKSQQWVKTTCLWCRTSPCAFSNILVIHILT